MFSTKFSVKHTNATQQTDGVDDQSATTNLSPAQLLQDRPTKKKTNMSTLVAVSIILPPQTRAFQVQDQLQELALAIRRGLRRVQSIKGKIVPAKTDTVGLTV